MQKTLIPLCAAFFCWSAAAAQASTLTLEDCYARAEEQYPLTKQKDLIEKSKEYTIANLAKGYLPQINFTGQATYQSDVTKITLPSDLPFQLDINPPAKDQYKFYGEVSQSFTDAFFIEPNKKLAANQAEADQQQLAVQLYALKERINQLYFGILLLDGQLQQTELLQKDIQTGIKKVTAAIANGVAYKSSKSELQAELLKAEQHTIELQANRKAFLSMLGLFLQQDLPENTVLQTPVAFSPLITINRPELHLFELQKNSFALRDKLLVAKTLPRAGVFFQGGYSQPGLNMLRDGFAGYYYLGVRLGWSLSGFYTFRKDRKLLDVSANMVDVQRETFLFNTNFAMRQQSAEVKKMVALIETDDEIINLRTDIKNTAQAQLENGVITSNDYLTKVNAEDQARQSRTLHRLQLLMAEYNLKTTSGN